MSVREQTETEWYDVYYRDVFIGVLTVDTAEGKHCYRPVSEGVAAVRDRTPLTREMIDGTGGFVEPIPFFQNRIRNMKRWGLTELNYQTDYFLLKKRT